MTTPTAKPDGRFLTKLCAALREAVMRSGSTSWASIEPERSSASTTVPCLRSAVTETCGRASPDRQRRERGAQQRGRHEAPGRARRLDDLREHADVAEADRVARLAPAREQEQQPERERQHREREQPEWPLEASSQHRAVREAQHERPQPVVAGGEQEVVRAGRADVAARPARGPRRRPRRSARAAACAPCRRARGGRSPDRRGRPRRCRAAPPRRGRGSRRR